MQLFAHQVPEMAYSVSGYLHVDTHEWLSLIHISEPTRLLSISYADLCLKKKKKKNKNKQ